MKRNLSINNKSNVILSSPKPNITHATVEEAIQKRITPRDNSSIIPGLNMEEIKHSLDLLKFALDYSEAIVETVKVPLIVLDKKLKVLTANRSFYETFKVKPKETENKLIYKLGNKEWDIPKLRILLEKILPANTHFDNYEVEINLPHLGCRIMLLSARRTYRQVNGTEAILLAFEDITDRRLLETQKDDFIGIVSHELRTPLTGMKAFSQILEKHLTQNNDSKGSYLLSRMSKQMDVLTELMASFVNVYKVQNGKLILNKKKFILEDLISSIVSDFKHTTPTHHIDNKCKTRKTIYADKERIGQVIVNLISNAVKYSPDADKIIITSSNIGGHISISVRDFGLGIPLEEQAKVFDRFFRVAGKKEKNISGLGLGLFISHEIITQHNGKIMVESKDRKGSTFTFILPTN